MFFGHRPHILRPGHNVLVWGASGGLGSFAVQLCAVSGANAIGVISDESKREFVLSLGAKGVLNRKDFNCWGAMPQVGSPEYDAMDEARKFGKAIWDITGKGNDVDFVFEHPGEQTFPVSCLVVKRGGMVVFCAGTTGYNITFDARYVWMRQKRIQGSHFANLYQASQANRLMVERRLDPCMSEVFPWADIPRAHTKMWKNEHLPGNMAVLVNAPDTGLRTSRTCLPPREYRAPTATRVICLRLRHPLKRRFRPAQRRRATSLIGRTRTKLAHDRGGQRSAEARGGSARARVRSGPA